MAHLPSCPAFPDALAVESRQPSDPIMPSHSSVRLCVCFTSPCMTGIFLALVAYTTIGLLSGLRAAQRMGATCPPLTGDTEAQGYPRFLPCRKWHK